MVLQNLARTKSIRAGLYSTHLLEGLTARASSSRRCRIYVVPTLVQLQGSHISQVYYTIAGKIWSARYIGAVAYI